ALGYGNDIRLYACMLYSPPFTAASRTALYLVGDEQNAVLIADPSQFAHELRRSRKVAAFALNGFDKDRSTPLRRHDGLEHPVFDIFHALGQMFFRRHAFRLAIHVGIRHMRYARNQREEAASLLCL